MTNDTGRIQSPTVKMAKEIMRLRRLLTQYRDLLLKKDEALTKSVKAMDKMLRLLGALPVPEAWRARWHKIFKDGEAAHQKGLEALSLPVPEGDPPE